MSEQAKPVCYHCRLPIKNGLADWHQTRHAKPTYCVDALRAALDQERADAALWRWLCEHHPDVLAQISPAPEGLVVRLSGRGDGGNDG